MNHDDESDLETELEERCPRCGGPVFTYFLHCDATLRCTECSTMWSETEWDADRDRAPSNVPPPTSNIL